MPVSILLSLVIVSGFLLLAFGAQSVHDLLNQVIPESASEQLGDRDIAIFGYAALMLVGIVMISAGSIAIIVL